MLKFPISSAEYIIICIVFIILLLPIIMVVYIAIAIDALLAGEALNVFYLDPRLSTDKRFSMLKFRIVKNSVLQEHQYSKPDYAVRAIEKKEENLSRIGIVLHRVSISIQNFPANSAEKLPLIVVG